MGPICNDEMKTAFDSVEKAIRDVISDERDKELKDKDWAMYCCSSNLLTTNTHYLEDSSCERFKHYMEEFEDWNCLEDSE